MKLEREFKVILSFAFLATIFIQPSFSQDTTDQHQLSQLLSKYSDIKDALVAGNARLASDKAIEFIKTVNSIDYKLVSEGNINALLKDATPISESKDINVQRVHFSNLSNNMATLVKAFKLSGMLTSGNVIETITH